MAERLPTKEGSEETLLFLLGVLGKILLKTVSFSGGFYDNLGVMWYFGVCQSKFIGISLS